MIDVRRSDEEKVRFLWVGEKSTSNGQNGMLYIGHSSRHGNGSAHPLANLQR